MGNALEGEGSGESVGEALEYEGRPVGTTLEGEAAGDGRPVGTTLEGEAAGDVGKRVEGAALGK